MTTWQAHIIAKIAPSTQLSLVYDPHGLVRAARVQALLSESGYQLYIYTDSTTFRIDYEAELRPQMRANRLCYILVIVPYPQSAAKHLPYVMLHQHADIEITLSDLFPMLHINPLTELTSDDVDVLWPASQTVRRQLDSMATQQFLLRELYSIDISRIHTREDALAALCGVHYKQQQLPAGLQTVLAQHPVFQQACGPMLPQVLSSAPRFLQYLRDEWQNAAHRYMPTIVQTKDVLVFDFSHPSLTLHLITFFHLRYIEPFDIHTPVRPEWPEWLTAGLQYDAEGAAADSLDELRAALSSTIPSIDDVYTQWLKYAQEYARYITKRAEKPDAEYQPWQVEVDSRFREWLLRHYKMLHSLAPNTPVMVHHIAQNMQRFHQQHPTRKLALVVVDGMALHQWVVLQEHLLTQLPTVTMTNSTVFAWIPTVTNVSRQAIFAGTTPKNFADSILTTNAEERLWQKLWSNDLPKHKIGYQRRLGDGQSNAAEDIAPFLHNPQMQILGLVVDSIDGLVHSASLGMHGLQQQVTMWGQHGYLKTLIQTLVESGYDIWMTSDHGNCAAIGAGTLSEGVLVDQRGARARVYPNETLRNTAIASLSGETIAWPSVELPQDFLPVLPTGFQAFLKTNEHTISHGGTSISEVIVPFVRITKGTPV